MSITATYSPPNTELTAHGDINMGNVKRIIDLCRRNNRIPSTLKMHPITFSLLVDEMYKTRDLLNTNTREQMERMKHSSDATLYNLRVEKDINAPINTLYIS